METHILQRVNHNCTILFPVYVFQKLPHSISQNFTWTVLSRICHFETIDLLRNSLACQILSRKLLCNSFCLTERTRSLHNPVISVWKIYQICRGTFREGYFSCSSNGAWLAFNKHTLRWRLHFQTRQQTVLVRELEKAFWKSKTKLWE